MSSTIFVHPIPFGVFDSEVNAAPLVDCPDGVVKSQARSTRCVTEQGVFKTMPLPGCAKRFPVVGVGHVLASIPTTRLCFFRAAPTGTVDLDSSSEEGNKSWDLVKYVEPVLESSRVRALVERMTPAVLEKVTAVELGEDVANEKAMGSLDIHVEEQADRDARVTYGPKVFHALFFPPRFLHAVVEDFRAQAREALIQSIFCPVVEPVLTPVPADFILSIADEAASCRPVVPETVSLIPSTINEQRPSSSPSSSDASIFSAIDTPPSSPSASSTSSSSYPPTPSSTSTPSFEDTPISTKNTEHTYLATPSPTPPRTQERSRPHILMPFVNRLVEQHQHANARIPLSGQAVAATPSPPSRPGRQGKKNDNNSPRTPTPAHLSNTPRRPPMLATPPPTPSPASCQSTTPAGHGKGNAARGGMEKHWRKRRPKKASASPLRDNVYATPSATPARSQPLAQ